MRPETKTLRLQALSDLGIPRWEYRYVGERRDVLLPKLTSKKDLFVERCKQFLQLAIEVDSLMQSYKPEVSVGRWTRKVKQSWKNCNADPAQFTALIERMRDEHSLSMKDVCGVCGISVPALYKCYRRARGEDASAKISTQYSTIYRALKKLRNMLWAPSIELLKELSPEDVLHPPWIVPVERAGQWGRYTDWVER